MKWPWWKRYSQLEEEIRAHIAMSVREREERGESAEDARAAALREFGNVGLVNRRQHGNLQRGARRPFGASAIPRSRSLGDGMAKQLPSKESHFSFLS